MSSLRTAWLRLSTGICVFLLSGVSAREQPQEDPAASKNSTARQTPTPLSLQSIAEEYSRQLILLEKQRLERLAELAAQQSPQEAIDTYETLFRLAIASNRFVEAEPIANRLLKTNLSLPPAVNLLARTVDIVGTTDRGAYDESLAELKQLIDDRTAATRVDRGAATVIDTPTLLAICDAYFQRLFQAGQFDVARKAAEIVLAGSKNEALRETCEGHLRQLTLVGKLAPRIIGTDVDGKRVDLAELRGKPVLVVFWASWCQANADEIQWLDYVYSSFKDRDFRIVGINVDGLSAGSTTNDGTLRTVRRFLLDHNVRWPNLLNGTGERDFAQAYGVTEIPANFMIGRDGKVTHLHLSRKNIANVVANAIAR